MYLPHDKVDVQWLQLAFAVALALHLELGRVRFGGEMNMNHVTIVNIIIISLITCLHS